MGKRKFKNTYYVKIFLLAREGLQKKQIAKILGVERVTLDNWIEKDLAVKDAYKRGKKKRGKDGFIEYIYNRLPLKLQKLYDKIEAYDKTRNGVAKIEAILANRGEKIRQHLFLHALICCSFNPSEAMRKVNIRKYTLDNWIRKNPDFADLVNEILYHKKNYVESALIDLVTRRDTQAVIHANKSLNNDRGYGEKKEKTVNMKGQIKVEHDFTISIGELGIPLEIKKIILEAIREKKKENKNESFGN